MIKKHISSYSVLKIAVFLMFLGRAWQHFFVSPDYNYFFWQPGLFSWAAKLFWGLEWNEFLSNPSAQSDLKNFVKFIGVIYLISAFSVLKLHRRWAKVLVLMSNALLIPFGFLHFAGFAYNWAMLVEFIAQFTVPLFLVFYSNNLTVSKKYFFLLKVVIALTFTCHGLYAAGVFPVPQKFVSMTINSFGVNRDFALIYLKIAGWLDFIAALALFIPKITIQKVGLWYMVFWGFVTALARLVANYYSFDAANSIMQWLHEFLIRAPHYLIPLVIITSQKRHELL